MLEKTFENDKETFKKLMLEAIERFKNTNEKWGLCFIARIIHYPDYYLIPDFYTDHFLIAPENIPLKGYDINGEIRNMYNPDCGYWWEIDMLTANVEEWYAPRIEYLKNL